MPEDAKPKKIIDELFFGEGLSGRPYLSLKCNRDNCWLQGSPVKEWHEGHIDYTEVSAEVTMHQFQHLGSAMANIFKGLQP